MRRIHAATLLCIISAPLAPRLQAPEWRAVEDLRIGSDTMPDEILTTVGGIAVGAGGTVYVIQPREGLVKVFNARGRFVRTIGRRGAGPGEFQLPRGSGWKGDSLWVADLAQRRISFFSPDGRFLRMQQVPLPSVALAIARDGTIIAAGSAPAQAVALGQVSRVPLLRIRGEPSSIDTLAMLDIRNQVWRIASDPAPAAATMYVDQPFSPATLWNMSADGRSLWMLDRSPASDARPASFEVTRLTLSSNARDSWRLPYSPVVVSAKTVDSIVGLEVKRGLDRRTFANASVAEVEVRRGLYLPTHAPPVSDFLPGRDGTLWIRLATREADSRWIVVDASGQVEATVRIPGNVRVMQADRTAVWGSARDSLGVEAVVRYALRKP
jgi:hypothetical protein